MSAPVPSMTALRALERSVGAGVTSQRDDSWAIGPQAGSAPRGIDVSQHRLCCNLKPLLAGALQRFGLDAYRPLTSQDRFRQCSTNPQIVVSLSLAALRIRSDSSVEHLRSIVVLGPGGRIGVLERLRFNA